jgi:hypothetical protein
MWDQFRQRHYALEFALLRERYITCVRTLGDFCLSYLAHRKCVAAAHPGCGSRLMRMAVIEHLKTL